MAIFKHEHIVRLSAPLDFDAPKVTRDQLWDALQFSIVDPENFIDFIKVVSIQVSHKDQSNETIHRILQFANIRVEDCVTFKPKDWILFSVKPGEGFPASQMKITIEEPEADVFFLRFSYEEENEAKSEEELQFLEFRKAAWEQKDRLLCERLLEFIYQDKLPKKN